MMGYFFQSDENIKKYSFCAIYYASTVRANSPTSNPSIYCLYFCQYIKQSNIKKYYLWKNTFVILCTTNYNISYQSMKPPLYIFSHQLTTNLCCFQSIKITTKQPIQTLTLFFDHYLFHPPPIVSFISTNFRIFYL